MTEDFLCYLWKYKLIDSHQCLTSGESIELIEPGIQNMDSGPDFFNARIRIGDTLWAGNVEMHTTASHWISHGHHKDMAYNNVILHVVFTNDKAILRKNNDPIPTLALEDKIDLDLLVVYQQLIHNKNWIPCAHLIPHVNRFVIHNWLDRMIVERMERRGEEIGDLLNHQNQDWNECFYQSLAKGFGFKVNSLPFELVAKSTPLSLLSKHKNDPFQLEAILFGQSGLLKGRYRGDYFQSLKKEYKFFFTKYKLLSIDAHLWRFMRMRPSNFPTLRLSQFAALIYQSSFLFSSILSMKNASEVEGLFKVQASKYWDTHYTFKSRSKFKVKSLGKNAIQLLLINTVIPYLYTYGKIKKNPVYKERSLKFLEQIAGENNAVTREWKKLGLPSGTAYQTQSLLELKSRYCNRKRCLECSIGNAIFNACVD